MSRYTALDNSGKRHHKCQQPQLLSLERLEQRLTLSTTSVVDGALILEGEIDSGRFVDLAAIVASEGKLDGLPIAKQHIEYSARAEEGGWVEVMPSDPREDASPEAGGEDLWSTTESTTDFDRAMNPQMISLPEMGALSSSRPEKISPNSGLGGGTVDVAQILPLADPPIGGIGEFNDLGEKKSASLETSQESDPTLSENATAEAAEFQQQPLGNLEAAESDVSPTGDREVSFRVASLSLPNVLGKLEHSRATPTDSDTPDDYSKSETALSPVLLEGSDPVPSSAASGNLEQKANSKVSRSEPQQAIDPAVDSRASLDTGLEVLPDRKAAALTKEEAREIAFADWRNHDLLSAPVLIALASTPLALRRRRERSSDVVQVPTKEASQDI